jgi:hypothetical protein
VLVVSIVRRVAAPLVLAAALLAAGAGSAHASLLAADASCDDYSYSQVFLPWADPAYYTLAPGGDFEHADKNWQLVGASRVTNENEAFNVGGDNDHASLSLPDGAVAVSPGMCVGLGEPTLRMFFKQTSGLGLARLRVDVLFETATGTTLSQSIGWVGTLGHWSPSQQMPIVANLLPLLDGGTPVAFQFTAVGGSFLIDDVYVDPWSKG